MTCKHGKQQYDCINCWKKDQFEVCSWCPSDKKFTDLPNMESIRSTGLCLSHDHVLGDATESQVMEAMEAATV